MNDCKLKIRECKLCNVEVNVDNLECFDFDHLDEQRTQKVDTISNLCSKRAPLKQIDAELEKCRLLCANCHRIHTFSQLNYSI